MGFRKMPLAALLSMGAGALAGQAGFAQSDSASAGPSLEEIVVTARKREESLQEVPLSVTALTATDISNRQVTTIDDLAKFAPGLVFSKSFGRSNERPVVRGLASVLAGTNATVETGVAYFVDGVYYPGDIQTLDMAEVERVEVIRGPQSALYGRNTYAGAINFITRRPGDEVKASISGGADADERQISGRISGRLSDTLTGSLSARYFDFDGQWKNELTGKTIGAEESVSFGATLNFNPTDNIEFRLRAAHNRDRDNTRPLFYQSPQLNNCAPGTRSLASFRATGSTNNNQYFCGEITARPIYLNDAPVTQPIVQVPGIPNVNYVVPATPNGVYDTRQGVAFSGVHRDLDLLLASFSWDLGGSGYTFSMNAGSRSDDRKTGADSDHSAMNIIGANINGVQATATGASSAIDRYRDWSLEAKIESPQDQRFRWSLGAYKFDWEQKQHRIDFASLNGQDRPQQIFTIENDAMFGSVEFDLTDKLSASAEIRRAEEQKRQRNFGATATSRTTGIVNVPGGPQFLVYDSSVRGNDTWKSTTPRITVNYKANSDLTLYANYAKGYKPGGFNGSIAIANGRPQDEAFDQEESVNYEIGMKSSWLDRRLMLNVAVFKMDVTSIQLTTPIQASTGAVTSISTNQGDGEIKGIEIETKFAATDELTLGFNYALADTEFTAGCDDMQFTITSGGGIYNPNDPNSVARNLNGKGSCSIAGNEFPLAAKHTASLTADFVRPVFGGNYEFYLNSDLSYTSKKWVQVHNLAYTGAATLLGARFGIQTDDWKIGVYGRNLTNEDSSPGATRWLQLNLFGVPGATLNPGLPPTSVASYSLPRGFFGVLRRERQVGLEFSYNF